MRMSADRPAPQYSVSFGSRLFGGKCNKEVTVDLNPGQASMDLAELHAIEKLKNFEKVALARVGSSLG